MGVLEYLRDVPSVLDWLAKHVPVCVLSYVYAENNRYSLRGMREAIGRLQAGWMNNYREDELRSLFRERGFVLLREERWEDKTGLFVFSQRRSLAGDAAAIRRPRMPTVSDDAQRTQETADSANEHSIKDRNTEKHFPISTLRPSQNEPVEILEQR